MAVKTAAPPAGGLLRRARTTPGRVRMLTVLVVLTLGALATFGSLAIDNARNGVRVIGHGAGPQVVATGDLYYALSDMNAQVANVLLAGREESLGISRTAALERYEDRRTQASRAVMQATSLAAGDSGQDDTIREVLDGIGKYERLASQAMILDARTEGAGPLPQQAIDLYREANTLMNRDVLPKARAVTVESDESVQGTYERAQSQVSNLPLWIAVSGLATILALIGLQVYLSARFRRILNPALVLATVATFVLVVASLFVLSVAQENLTAAKTNGHDKILSVSRSRAANNTLQANEGSYRLDVRQNVASAEKLRGIEERMGPLLDGFANTDRTMVALIKDHRQAFVRAIAESDKALNGWHLIFPGAVAGIALLVLLGVRPRLAEYR
ncbi:hypothetical protein ABN034_06880 [Actinopolymorpha sp. B11F2]|uniref:hypothetical protein n=1 Tax=Actinopolymorpha sp. B11F2 TaxID=3160862 RepID=UPI0032E4CC39